MASHRLDGSAWSLQSPILVLICAGAIAGASLLHLTGSEAFRPYFGPIHPVLATTGILALGLASLRFLDSGDWVLVDRPRRGSLRFALPAALATALVIPVVLVDLMGGFPQGLNVPLPESLVFYPVMALVAETVFHVVPLALLISATKRLASPAGRSKVLVGCLIVVALPEPIFQVGTGAGESPLWASAYVAVHLLAFNLLAVHWLRRYGFLSMLSFRLVYYVWWHIAWGALRLRLLF